jgi:hypothetical protein
MKELQKNNKGNPVPSIDKIKQLYNDYEEGKATHIHTLYEIGQILKNGVETNKEQPKCEHPYKRVHRVGDKAFCNKCRKPIH